MVAEAELTRWMIRYPVYRHYQQGINFLDTNLKASVMKYFLLIVSFIFFGEAFGQNNWTATNGPFGGNITSLKRSPGGTLYSIVNQRLYQSTNSGDAWTLTTTTVPTQLYLNDLMIDTDGKMYGVYFSTLYTSADNGLNWTTTASNLFQNGTKIETVGPDKVFVVWGYSGVYVSIDKGVTWKQISTEQVSNGIGLVSNAAGDIFYTTNAGKILKHAYQGLTANWSATNFIQTSFTLTGGDYFNSMTVDGAGNLYVATYYDFYKSTNGGTTFPSIKANLSPLTYFYGALATSLDNSISLFLNDKIYKTINQGTTWTNTANPAYDYGSSVTSVVYASASTYFMGTSGDGVLRTQNTGSTWELKSNGLTGANTTGIVVANTTNRLLVVKGGRGYWTSTDAGTTWTISVLSDYVNEILKLTDGTILMYGSRVFRSIDNGATFSPSSNYYSHYKIVEAANGDLYGFKYGKIDKSIDKGVTWTDMTITGLPTTMQPYEAAIDATTNMMVHGWDGSAYSTYKIVGTTATAITLPYTSSFNNVFYLDGKFYASQFSAYYYSSDLGTTWTTVGFSGNALFPLKNASYSGIAVSKNGTLQITQDNGGTWNNTNLPVSTAYITDIATNTAGDFFATAYGSSVLKFTDELLVNPTTLPPYINFNWQPLNGPYGGSITRVKAHPDGTTLFAIANGSFVWKYSGGTWTRLSPIAGVTTIFDVDIDAAGNVYILPVINPQKIYKSTDKGVNWTPLTSTNLPASSSAIRRMEILSDGSILAFGNFGGLGRVYKSSDGGATFTQKFASALNTNYSRLPAESPGGVVATVGTSIVSVIIDGQPQQQSQYVEGLLISLNKGDTWTLKPFPSIVGPTGFVGSLAFDGTTLLATVILDSSIPNWVTQLVKSTDNGTTWTVVTTPGPTTNLSYGKRFVVLPGGEYLLTLQNPFFDCYRSTDKGATWANVGNFGDIYNYTDWSGSTAYLMGNIKGVQKTTDGGLTISTVNTGMPINTAFDIEILNGKDLIVGATSPYHSSNFGTSFTLATPQVAGSFLKTNDGVIAYGSRRLQKSTDGGKTYTEIGDDRYFSFVTESKTGNAYWAFSNSEIPGTSVKYGLFYSTDLINWTESPLSGLPDENNFFISDMVIDDADRVYALVADNQTGITEVYKIVFGSAINISSTIGTQNPYSIFYFNNQIYLYDGDGIIYKSTDGEVWTQSSAPAGGSLIVTNNYLFVTAGNSVLWLSRDNGNSWQSVGDTPLSGVNFRDVAVNPFDGYAYATLSSSVVKKSGNIVIPNDNAKPLSTTLLPAHNATNVAARPAITITFDEITNAIAGKKLRIFDLAQPALPVVIMDANEAVRTTEKSWTFTLATDLDYLKTYFVIVDAGAFADIFGNTFLGITSNSSWRFTTQEVPDTQAPTIVIATADLKQTKGVAKRVDITVTDNKNLPVDKTKIYYRGVAKLDTEPFTATALSVLSGGGTISTTFTIEAQDNWYDEMGLEFYFEAEDASGNKKRAPAAANTYLYSYVTYPTGISPVLPSSRISLGGKATNYRMISIPYELQDNQVLTILDELGGVDNKKWRLFTYAGGDQFTENPATFIRGKGYWINVKNSPGEIKIDGSTTPSNNRTSFYKMNLAPGWNQIGNPYPVEINWDEIRTGQETTIGLLKVFGPTQAGPVGYSDEVILLPYQGAFVFVKGTSAVNNLVFRFKGITTGGRKGSSEPESDLSKPNWFIPISAINNEIINTMGGVGMNENANLDWDQFDDLNPPRFIDYAELAFNKKYNSDNLAKDVVPAQDEYMWEFTVNASEGQTQLIWDNAAITGDKDLMLFDLDRQKLIDMKLAPSYSFNAKEGNSFSIHFGKDLHVNPTAVTLGNPFPNPTNSSATIGFTLPESKSPYQVQLEVYNSVGQRAAVLVNSNLQSGFYTSSWDTENNKTGLYFYRLSVTAKGTQKVLTQKIIINR
jgi:photosystem II stability/assembly factor-like uncharacterized protein